MRLVTFSESARQPVRTGMIGSDGGVIDIARAAKAARVALPFDADDMIALIASGRKGQAAIKQAAAKVKTSHHKLSKVKLLAPIARAAVDGAPPDRATLTDLTIRAYRIKAADVSPLLVWCLR